MEMIPLCEPNKGAVSRSSGPGRAPIGPVERLLAQAMNASELLYFFGAPLAHVVDYEERLRAARCEKTIREVARNCRTLHLHTHAAPPPAGAAPVQSGVANDA